MERRFALSLIVVALALPPVPTHAAGTPAPPRAATVPIRVTPASAPIRPAGEATESDSVRAARSATYAAWVGYGFVAGERVLFEDTFQGDRDGDFPTRWDLTNGQGAVSRAHGEPAFTLTEGDYAEVRPFVKGGEALGDAFAVEFDFFDNGGYGASVFLRTAANERKEVHVSYSVSTGGFEPEVSADYPGGAVGFPDAWHHAALAWRDGRLTCFVDQHRVLEVPRCGFVPVSVSFGGIATREQPVVIGGVRVTAGAEPALDRLLADGRLVTRALTFDRGGDALKPWSMGFVRSLADLLREHAELRVEIGAHAAGADSAAAQRLAEARARAVRARLVALGIDARRLTAKGLGAGTPPPGGMPEAPAAEATVELVKL